MRKWNTILSVLMLLIFMIHGIMGSFMLNGVGSSAGKLLAWIGVGILVVHTVIGVILTVQSLQTAKQSGKMYLNRTPYFGRDEPVDGNTDSAVIPYWLVWKGAEWDIYFVPFYNGKDGNSAFVRSGNLCSYFYQYPPIARIAGNHQL